MRAVLGAITVAAISTAAATTAHAQDVTASNEPTGDKSALLATSLSVAVPLAGGAIILANHLDRSTALLGIGLGFMIVGPSTGQWYAQETGMLGVTIRTVASIAVVYGNSLRRGTCDNVGVCDYSDRSKGTALIYGAIGVFAAATVFDIVKAPLAVSKWNHREIVLAPVALATPSNTTVAGLGLSGRF